MGVGVLGAPDPAPEAVTNYYVTPPPPPWKTAFLKPLPCSPLKRSQSNSKNATFLSIWPTMVVLVN